MTIIISGKRAKVEEARSRLVRELQTQAQREIVIPKEHHRKLIGGISARSTHGLSPPLAGKEGASLRQLEAETDCRIFVPGRDQPSDVIIVKGPRDGMEKALHQIQLVSDEQVRAMRYRNGRIAFCSRNLRKSI